MEFTTIVINDIAEMLSRFINNYRYLDWFGCEKYVAGGWVEEFENTAGDAMLCEHLCNFLRIEKIVNRNDYAYFLNFVVEGLDIVAVFVDKDDNFVEQRFVNPLLPFNVMA
jgi:hypothetical protein